MGQKNVNFIEKVLCSIEIFLTKFYLQSTHHCLLVRILVAFIFIYSLQKLVKAENLLLLLFFVGTVYFIFTRDYFWLGKQYFIAFMLLVVTLVLAVPYVFCFVCFFHPI